MGDFAKASIGGRELRCRHCGHDQFFYKTGLIDRTFWGGFSLEGLTGGFATTIYVCARCGCGHFFMNVPGATHQFGTAREEAPPERVPEEACLSCGATIPGDAAACPKCGWTWQQSQ